jgi:hypothetical protein
MNMNTSQESAYFKEKTTIIRRRYDRRKDFFTLLFVLIIGGGFMGFAARFVFGMASFWLLIFGLIFCGLLIATIVKGLELIFEGQRDAAILQEIELERERDYQMLLASQGGKYKREEARRLRVVEDGEIEEYFETDINDDEDVYRAH